MLTFDPKGWELSALALSSHSNCCCHRLNLILLFLPDLNVKLWSPAGRWGTLRHLSRSSSLGLDLVVLGKYSQAREDVFKQRSNAIGHMWHSPEPEDNGPWHRAQMHAVSF